MKKILLIIAINISFVCHGQSLLNTVNANNTFALELFKEVFDVNTNLFISPYSISSALAMTYAGARNETETQMIQVLHFDSAKKNTLDGFAKINESFSKLKDDTSTKFSIANAIWKEKNIQLKPEYLKLINSYFKSPIYSITNAKAINDWAAKATNNKIKNLVDDEIISEAKLVLTNAIYFKSDWKTAFDINDTKRDTFYTGDNKRVLTPMMFQSKNISFFQDNENQVIELPYKGPFTMTVILPKKENKLDGLINMFDNTYYQKISNKLAVRKVNVILPRFNIEASFNLNNTLQNMGLSNAFSQDAADFSAMYSGLFIDDVIHKSFIEVNEKGTEAAAATAVTMTLTSSMNEEITFNANKPFLFLISDNATKSILFIGSMQNPQQK